MCVSFDLASSTLYRFPDNQQRMMNVLLSARKLAKDDDATGGELVKHVKQGLSFQSKQSDDNTVYVITVESCCDAQGKLNFAGNFVAVDVKLAGKYYRVIAGALGEDRKHPAGPYNLVQRIVRVDQPFEPEKKTATPVPAPIGTNPTAARMPLRPRRHPLPAIRPGDPNPLLPPGGGFNAYIMEDQPVPPAQNAYIING